MFCFDIKRVECMSHLLTKSSEYDVNQGVSLPESVVDVMQQQGFLSGLTWMFQPSDAGEAELEGCTALHRASANGHCECVSLLCDLAPAIDILSMDSKGRTALHLACLQRHADVVLLFLSRIDAHQDESFESIVHARDKEGCTPFITGCASGSMAVLNAFISFCEGSNDIKIDQLIEGIDDSGRNCLWWAAAGGHQGVVSSLMSLGAKNQKDENDVDAVEIALHYSHLQVAASISDISIT